MMFLLLTLAFLSFSNAQLLGGLTARSQLAGCLTADGQVLFAGGVGNILSALLNTVEVVATLDNAVSNAGSLSVGRFALSAATAGNFSVFAGGLTGAVTANASFSAVVDVYDAVNGTWSTATLATARAYHCVGATVDYLYIAGGQTATSAYTDTVEVFNAVTGQLEVSANLTLSQARSHVATATVNSTVYFAGGLYLNGSLTASAVVDVYDEVSATWDFVELSEARQQIAVVAYGDLVFFAGGADAAGTATTTVDIWSVSNASFTAGTLTVARYGLQAVVVGELVVFLGGYTGASLTASNVVDIYNTVDGTWTASTLAVARADFAAVAVDTKVYLAGGAGTGGLTALLIGTSTLEVVDFAPSTPTPTPTSVSTPTPNANLLTQVVFDLPGAAAGRAQLAATVTASGDVLVAGGLGATLFNAITSINVSSNVATDLLDVLSVARYGLVAQTSGDVSVFAGGALVGGLTFSGNVDVYNSATNVWTSVQLTTPRAFHASATVGTKIYFAGGQTTTLAFTNTVEVYDVVSGTVTTLTGVLSEARGYLTATVVGTKILFCGGRAGAPGALATFSAAVDVYETADNTWTVLSLSEGRAELAASSVNNLVLIGGGISASASAVVDIYDADLGVFLNATAADVLSVARYGLQAVTIGVEVLFVGGFDGVNALATVDIYNADTGVWTVKELNFPRYNFAVAVAVDGSVYFVGGQDSLVSFLASVEVYAGVTPVNTPTPTPAQVTPTPTPVVTPTPAAPVPVPTNVCVQTCQDIFDTAEGGFNVATGYTIQCQQWTSLFECIQTNCVDTPALENRQATCEQTADIQDFCDCGKGKSFRPPRVVGAMASFNAQLVIRFEALVGIVPSSAGGVTALSTNPNDNTFSLNFVWEDTTTYADGSSVNIDTIANDWQDNLAEYFNTNKENFVLRKNQKRAQQQGSFNGEAVDNSGTSGVSQLTLSCAFLMATFLLHVLF